MTDSASYNEFKKNCLLIFFKGKKVRKKRKKKKEDLTGLPCYTQAFSSCSEQNFSLVLVCRLLIALASIGMWQGL